MERAMQGNWKALRELRPASNKEWEPRLAESLHPKDPHECLRAHYESIFNTGEKIDLRSHSPPPAADIAAEELDFAIAQGHPRKSVGHDGVSHELLAAIALVPEGKQQILAWFNSILHGGDIPPDWLDSLMILLPKVRHPKQPKDTRPISMGCAAEKLLCRILLERTKPFIQLREPWQCAGSRRQTCDFLYSLQHLFEEEREWSSGLCVLKVDFRRAFDSVIRNKLLARLFQLQGNCEEFRVWERLMIGTTCTLRSPWGQTTFGSTVGIRQGSIESPAFFGVLVEWILSDLVRDKKWRNYVSTYRDLQVTQAAFMDDLLLWDGRSSEILDRYKDLENAFAAWGLHINPEKCSLYCSPRHEGDSFIQLGDHTLYAQDFIEVMNIPFRVGANTQELLQRVWQKARDKFWATRHLFLSDTPIGNRIRLLDRIIGGCILWCSSAFSPETTALPLPIRPVDAEAAEASR